MTVAQAHDIADELEMDIAETFSGADVIIHIEPCPADRSDCRTTCPMIAELERFDPFNETGHAPYISDSKGVALEDE
jgi:hypothetical protein